MNVLQKPVDVTLGQHLAAGLRAAGRHLVQAAFTLVCLPYEAYFSLDAVVRTAWRMLISHQRLLEWNPSSDRDRNRRDGLAGSFRAMRVAPVMSAAAVLALAASKPAVLAAAGPILVLWFFSPAVTWWVSRPIARREARLTGGQTLFPAEAFPEDLGVLRDLHRPRRPLAAAGQLSGASRCRDRDPAGRGSS